MKNLAHSTRFNFQKKWKNSLISETNYSRNLISKIRGKFKCEFNKDPIVWLNRCGKICQMKKCRRFVGKKAISRHSNDHIISTTYTVYCSFLCQCQALKIHFSFFIHEPTTHREIVHCGSGKEM